MAFKGWDPSDIEKETDAYALRYWAARDPNAEREKQAVAEGTKGGIEKAVEATTGFFKRSFDPSAAPPPPDQPNRGLPVDQSPDAAFKPATTQEWKAWEDRMFKYSGAKSPEDLAKVRDWVGSYKQQRFNENWAKGVALQEQGNPEAAAHHYERAYSYFTNGQGATFRGDPKTGKVLSMPYQEETSIAGPPQAFDAAQAKQVLNSLGPEAFGRDPTSTGSLGWNQERRAGALLPGQLEQQKAALGHTRASTASMEQATQQKGVEFGQEQEAINAWRGAVGGGQPGAIRPDVAAEIDKLRQAGESPEKIRIIEQIILQESSGGKNLVGGRVGIDTKGGDPKQHGQRATGIAQMMPNTAKAAGVTDTNDPTQVIPAMSRMLGAAYDKYGDWLKTAVSWHQGGDWSGAWESLGPNGRQYAEDMRRRLQGQPNIERGAAALAGVSPAAALQGQQLLTGQQALDTGAAKGKETETQAALLNELRTGLDALQAREDLGAESKQQQIQDLLQSYMARAEPGEAHTALLNSAASVAKVNAKMAGGEELKQDDVDKLYEGMNGAINSALVDSTNPNEVKAIQTFFGGAEGLTTANRRQMQNMGVEILGLNAKARRPVHANQALEALTSFATGAGKIFTEVDGAQFGMPGAKFNVVQISGGRSVLLPDTVVQSVEALAKQASERAAAAEAKAAEAAKARAQEAKAGPSALSVPGMGNTW